MTTSTANAGFDQERKEFARQFLEDVDSGRISDAATRIREVSQRFDVHRATALIAASSLELEHRQPLNRERPSAETDALPLSRVLSEAMADCPRSLPEQLIQAASYFVDSHYYDRADDLLDRVEVVAREAGDRINAGQVWAVRGLICSGRSQPDAALLCLWRGQQLFQGVYEQSEEGSDERRESMIGLSKVQKHIGNFCIDQDDYESAILYTGRSLSVREAFGDPEQVGACLMNIGLCHRAQGRHDLALRYFLRTLINDCSVLKFSARAITLSVVAGLCEQVREFELANKARERAIQLSPQMVIEYLRIGQNLLRLRQYEPALGMLEEALRDGATLSPVVRESAAQTTIALNDELGRPEAASACRERWLNLLLAEGILTTIEDPKLQQAIVARRATLGGDDHHGLAILDFALGDIPSSRRELERALDLAPTEQRPLLAKLLEQVLTAERQRTQPEEAVGAETEVELQSGSITGNTCRGCGRTFTPRHGASESAPEAEGGGACACYRTEDGVLDLHCSRCSGVFQISPSLLGRCIPCPECSASCRAPVTPSAATSALEDVAIGDVCPDCREALRQFQTTPVPAGSSHVTGFQMDVHPITNRIFLIYHRVQGLDWEPTYWKSQAFRRLDQPVTGVSLDDAEAFCAWRSRLTGQSWRVPTAAEWKRAALGDDGRRYPWGDDPPTPELAAYAIFEDEDAVPAPIGIFLDGASPWGIQEMAGNVWEWTSTVREGEQVVYLGGSCANQAAQLDVRDETQLLLRPMTRSGRDHRHLGFRCVCDEAPVRRRSDSSDTSDDRAVNSA
ncbi:MAG: SUMF1/EgtB/PvdO family nonheme iron enzyme [Planctomycetaceae bacterium]|nr:SUMF1/EgtB/PvdO family nonheme iron enzyme [Planctomycetaceae bacterium]